MEIFTAFKATYGSARGSKSWGNYNKKTMLVEVGKGRGWRGGEGVEGRKKVD